MTTFSKRYGLASISLIIILTPFLLFSQNSLKYTNGYKDLKWGISVADAKSLISDELIYVNEVTGTLKELGHTNITLEYISKIQGSSAVTFYDFIDDHLFSVHKMIQPETDSDIRQAFVVETIKEMTKEYKKGRRNQDGEFTEFVWKDKFVKIKLWYNSENWGSLFGTNCSDIELWVESNKYNALYEDASKQVKEFETKNATEKAKELMK